MNCMFALADGNPSFLKDLAPRLGMGGGLTVLWLLFICFLFAAMVFHKRRVIFLICLIGTLATGSITAHLTIRNGLISELSSEDDVSAEKAYLLLEKWYSIAWAVEALKDKSGTDNSKFYAAIRIGRARHKKDDKALKPQDLAAVSNTYIRPGFFSTNRINAGIYKTCIFRSVSIPEIIDYAHLEL